MATKKRTRKQPRGKAKKASRTKTKTATPSKKKAAVKKGTSKKASAKKAVTKSVATKAKPKSRNAIAAKTGVDLKKPVASDTDYPRTYRRAELGADSAGQSGDLQGLSDAEGADSESVDELVEEGNAFEADAVMGVQEADNTEGGEVRTHEVPEDDVPEEYLDKD